MRKVLPPLFRGISDWAGEGVTKVVMIASSETTWIGIVCSFYSRRWSYDHRLSHPPKWPDGSRRLFFDQVDIASTKLEAP